MTCDYLLAKTFSDPIHQHADGTWWWYEETWTTESGPYPSRNDAADAVREHAKSLLDFSTYKDIPEFKMGLVTLRRVDYVREGFDIFVWLREELARKETVYKDYHIAKAMLLSYLMKDCKYNPIRQLSGSGPTISVIEEHRA